MPSRVWYRWCQFMDECSFGPLHSDTQFGTLASLIYNANRAEKSAAKGPEDFFPSLKGCAAESEPFFDTRDGQLMLAQSLATAFPDRRK
jgi:hypothetical protein